MTKSIWEDFAEITKDVPDDVWLEPKPCPFCGHKKPQPFESMPPHRGGEIVYFVHCPICHASGPCCNSERDLTMEEAMAAWNNRKI